MNPDEPHDPEQAQASGDVASADAQSSAELPPVDLARPGFDPNESPSAALRKLAPPPKPAISRTPSATLDPPPPTNLSAPAPRAPMIVVGGEPSSAHVARGGAAQAWTRPAAASEPPARSSPSNAPPARPGVSPGTELRAKLGIQRVKDPARPGSVPAPAERPSPLPPSSPAATGGYASPPPAPPLPSFALPVAPPPAAVSAPPVAPPAFVEAEQAPLPSFAEQEPPTPLTSKPAPPPAQPLDLPVAPPEPPLPSFALPVAPPPPRAQTISQPSIQLAAPAPAVPSAKPPPPPPRDPARTKSAPELATADDTGPRLRAELAAALGAELTPAPPPVEALKPSSETPPDSEPNTNPNAATLTARAKSEPARLRGGAPRPRATTPEFIALHAPARPASESHPDGEELPGPPRVPNFPLAAGVPARPAPPRRSDPPVPASAIAVMKIVAVGDPSAEPVAEPEEASESEELALAAEGASPAVARSAELDELPEEDISTLVEPPSSQRRSAEPAPSSEVEVSLDSMEHPDTSAFAESERAGESDAAPERESAISIPPGEVLVDAPTPPPVVKDADQGKQPPPPPSRKPKTPSLPKPVPRAKRRAKPPWWEEVFGEDFVRASFRLNDNQIRREVDFIEESLGVANGGVVLDLGCGAGHHAVELSSRGYGVVGYDLSLYQLALAADVAQERGQKLNFLQGDMREMAFEEMFDGIFCWNTTFGYFEEEKNQYVAERVFHALRPGGMFLLDVVNRDYVASESPCQLWYEGDACVCMDDMALDFITSRMNVKRSVILDDGRTREATYSVRVYSLHELGKLLHDVGFRVTEASGHPATPGVFFGNSPRIIILAQKP